MVQYFQPMSKTNIETLLKTAFAPNYLLVVDDGHKHIGHEGAKHGGHFSVEIRSETFQGKTSLEKHRMIYKALDPIKNTIHALVIKAY